MTSMISLRGRPGDARSPGRPGSLLSQLIAKELEGRVLGDCVLHVRLHHSRDFAHELAEGCVILAKTDANRDRNVGMLNALVRLGDGPDLRVFGLERQGEWRIERRSIDTFVDNLEH